VNVCSKIYVPTSISRVTLGDLRKKKKKRQTVPDEQRPEETA
jgi:hypothetical protein